MNTSIFTRAAICLSDSVAWLRRNRRLSTGGETVQLNLGSALTGAPGWISIDNSPTVLFAGAPQPVLKLLHRASPYRNQVTKEEFVSLFRQVVFVHHSLLHGIPFDDDSVDHVYASHFLEHLDRREGSDLLAETYRVLKPGGALRISVPDLAIAIRWYLDGDRESAVRTIFGGAAGTRHQHRWMYDFELLRAALERTGFENINRRSSGIGVTPDLGLLDNRPEISLFVEARKPSPVSDERPHGIPDAEAFRAPAGVRG